MSKKAVFDMVDRIACDAESRYGDFSSTHEALGVALEEWNELCDAVRSNVLTDVASECVDLAAVLVRMAVACSENGSFKKRSVKCQIK